MISEIIHCLHAGHQGITKCRARAKNSVAARTWETVTDCKICRQFSIQPTEPLIPTPFPQLPWQKMFMWKKAKYLLLTDYYSRFVEVVKLPSESSSIAIERMKSVFACHEMPQEFRSDNGPQFSSALFHKFSIDYKFTHVTSSPRYPSSNGEAERGVQTVKGFLKKYDDPYLALLTYRSTPLHNGYIPAKLLMGRQLCTILPILPTQLKLAIPDYSKVLQRETDLREKQKGNFDSCHSAKDLVVLFSGDEVYVDDGHLNTQGHICSAASFPRSYQVNTPRGNLRRNRRHLRLMLNNNNSVTVTRSGRVSRKPIRYRS